MQSRSDPPQKFQIFKTINQIPGFILLIIRRQQYQLGLGILALLGIILSVGLITNSSFFSQAVDRVMLLQNLAEFSRVTGRPPFSTDVYVFPSNQNPLTVEDAERLSHQIANTLATEVGLPLRHLGIEIASGTMLLQPEPGSVEYEQGKDLLASISTEYIANISSHISIDAGNPFDEEGTSSQVVNIWIHKDLAQEIGIQVGDQFIMRPNVTIQPIPINVAGIWHAKDPAEEFWFGDPDQKYQNTLLVRRNDYIQYVQPSIASGSREVSWYVILNENELNPKDSAAYLAGFQSAQDKITKYLPGVHLNTPPLNPLKDFVQRNTTLTIILLGYNLPALAILLYFLLLISAIIAQWQRRETSILISRGMSLSGILILTLLEQFLLLLIGYPLGIIFGMLIARLMGYTSSFLSFTMRSPMPISMQGFSFPLTILALSVLLFARLWPIARANRQSIVTEEHEWARPSQGPFWYRYYLDLLLIFPTYYSIWQMSKRGSLAGLIISRPEDIYQDPVLIVVPALFMLTAALITMRLFSLVMRILDVLANRTPWLTIHLALRQLGRQSHEYISPLLLVIISLSMGIYTLSMATSLDHWLVDRIYYRVGADMTFYPTPFIEGETHVDGSWVPPPQKFTDAQGVQAATRVGYYTAFISLAPRNVIVSHFMAIDQFDFPAVAWWRTDLAPEPLEGLMSRLAQTTDGILVSRKFLSNNNFQIGDKVSISVQANDYTTRKSLFTIVGMFEYFPTVFEEQNITVIGNFDQLTALFGFIPTHEIWLKLDPGASEAAIRKAMPKAARVTVYLSQDAHVIISQEQAKMERVGIFGTLTVGYLAAASMAILGLLLYSYASLRDRVYRFSVLHAVGLLHRQIVTQVVMEYSFLAAFGALAGSLIGMGASRLFVPFFRYTGQKGIPLPPLIPLTADQSMRNLAIIFTLIIVSTEVATITSALRRRLVRIR